jgi:hypothetical protein
MSYIFLYLIIVLTVALLGRRSRLGRLFFTYLADLSKEEYPSFSLLPKVQKKTNRIFGKNAYKHFVNILFFIIVLVVFAPFMFTIAWLKNYRDRRTARNPETVPEKLQKLSESSDRLTRHALIKNLNTPPEALLALAQDFPFEVVEHPMFGLMLLENPRLIEEMKWSTLVSLFKQKEIPEIFFSGAATHQSNCVLESIVQHQSVTLPTLERIAARTSDSRIAQIIVNHPLTTLPCLQQWATQGNDSMKMAIAQAYFNQSLPHGEEILSLLIERSTENIRRVISQYHNLSDTLADQLLLSGSPALLGYLAVSPNTAKVILRKFASTRYNPLDDSMDLKVRVARNPSIPVDIINQLVADPDYRIRAAVAQRQDLSLNHCLQLALDKVKQVRKRLRRNRSITPFMLRQIATYPRLQVRQFVASHSNTPVDLRTLLLQQIADDRSSPPS